MTAERCPMQKNGFVPNDTIMGYVGIGHEVVVIPDNCLSTASDSTPMNGHEFPKSVIVSYFDTRLFSFIRKILRFSSDGRKRRKPTTFSYFCLPGDTNMGIDNSIFEDGDAFPNNNVRTDPYIGRQLCFRMNRSGWIYGDLSFTHSLNQPFTVRQRGHDISFCYNFLVHNCPYLDVAHPAFELDKLDL